MRHLQIQTKNQRKAVIDMRPFLDWYYSSILIEAVSSSYCNSYYETNRSLFS